MKISSTEQAYEKLHKGDVATASRLFQQAIQQQGNNARALNGLGTVRELQGRLHDAVRLYEAALRTDPQDAEAANNLAWTLATQEDDTVRNPARALQLARQATSRTERKNPAHLDTLAAALAAVREFKEAIAVGREARQLAELQGNAELMEQLNERLAAYADQRAVRSSAGRVVVQGPSKLGQLADRSASVADFREQTLVSLKKSPVAAEVTAALAWILATHDDARVRDAALALQFAQAASAATGGKYPMALEAVAAAQAGVGAFAEAAKSLHRAIVETQLQRPGADVAPLERRLEQYRQQREARESFEKIEPIEDEKLDPSARRLASAHLILGHRFEQHGERAGALAAYRQVIGLAPRCAAAHRGAGKLLLDAGFLPTAAEHLEWAFSLQPEDARTINTLGVARELAGRCREAVAHFEAASKRDSQWPEPVNNLAWLLAACEEAEVRDAPRALALSQSLCEGREPHARFLDTLAASQAANGKFEDAQRTQRFALRQLGGQDAALAVGMERRLQLYSLGKPYFGERQALVDLGLAFLQAKRLDLAEKHLSAALELRLENPVALNHMGVVRELQGRIQGAIG